MSCAASVSNPLHSVADPSLHETKETPNSLRLHDSTQLVCERSQSFNDSAPTSGLRIRPYIEFSPDGITRLLFHFGAELRSRATESVRHVSCFESAGPQTETILLSIAESLQMSGKERLDKLRSAFNGMRIIAETNAWALAGEHGISSSWVSLPARSHVIDSEGRNVLLCDSAPKDVFRMENQYFVLQGPSRPPQKIQVGDASMSVSVIPTIALPNTDVGKGDNCPGWKLAVCYQTPIFAPRTADNLMWQLQNRLSSTIALSQRITTAAGLPTTQDLDAAAASALKDFDAPGRPEQAWSALNDIGQDLDRKVAEVCGSFQVGD